jgi:hypothetical protein
MTGCDRGPARISANLGGLEEVLIDQEKKEQIRAKWSSISAHPLVKPGAPLAGRSTAILTGCFFMMLGVLLTFTICGAVIGLPLFAFGFLLVARGLF